MNGYLQRQRARDIANRTVSADTERQYMVDLFCLVLNNPEIMGKDVMGKKRLQKIVRATMKEYAVWCDMLTADAEADYLREKLDQKLKRIFEEDFSPFEVRYNEVRVVKTVNGKNRAPKRKRK